VHKLSAVVPMGPESKDFLQMKTWVLESISLGIQIILIRDSFSDQLNTQFLTVFKDEVDKNEITVVDSTGKSPGSSRNSGIAVAESDWITFWDCDDFPNPRSVLQEVENTPAFVDAVVGQYEINGIRKTTKDILDIAVNPGNWRIAYRKKFIGETKFATHSWGEDQLFMIETGFLAAEIHISNSVFYNYRVGLSNQLTNQKAHFASLEGAIAEAMTVSKAIPKLQRGRIAACIMILRMSTTYCLKSTGTARAKAIKHFIANNLRLLKIYRCDFVFACFALLARVIKLK
jgi:hypothetical protein